MGSTHDYGDHTTRVEPIETNTRILLFREASTNEDLRPLPRKARTIDFQNWVKVFDTNRDPFKHRAHFRQVVEAELVHD